MKLHSLGLFSNRPLFRDKRTSAPSVGTTFPGSWTLDQIFWPLADCKWKSIKQNDSLNRPIRMSIRRVDSIKFYHIFQDLNRISRLHSMLVSKPMLNLTWFGFDGSWYHFNYFVKMLISLDYKLRDAAIFQIALSWFFFYFSLRWFLLAFVVCSRLVVYSRFFFVTPRVIIAFTKTTPNYRDYGWKNEGK